MPPKAGNMGSILGLGRFHMPRSNGAPVPQLGFPGGSDSKAAAVMQETWVQSLGQEDPLKKEMATHSSTLAWKIPWMEEPGRLQSTRSLRVRQD